MGVTFLVWVILGSNCWGQLFWGQIVGAVFLGVKLSGAVILRSVSVESNSHGGQITCGHIVGVSLNCCGVILLGSIVVLP